VPVKGAFGALINVGQWIPFTPEDCARSRCVNPA